MAEKHDDSKTDKNDSKRPDPQPIYDPAGEVQDRNFQGVPEKSDLDAAAEASKEILKEARARKGVGDSEEMQKARERTAAIGKVVPVGDGTVTKVTPWPVTPSLNDADAQAKALGQETATGEGVATS